MRVHAAVAGPAHLQPALDDQVAQLQHALAVVGEQVGQEEHVVDVVLGQVDQLLVDRLGRAVADALAPDDALEAVGAGVGAAAVGQHPDVAACPGRASCTGPAAAGAAWGWAARRGS